MALAVDRDELSSAGLRCMHATTHRLTAAQQYTVQCGRYGVTNSVRAVYKNPRNDGCSIANHTKTSGRGDFASTSRQ